MVVVVIVVVWWRWDGGGAGGGGVEVGNCERLGLTRMANHGV